MATNSPQDNSNAEIIKNLESHSGTAPGKRFRKLLTWTIPPVLLVVILLIWGMRDSSTHIKYKTQPARLGDITVTVTATGNLQPINQVVVGSELSGTVKSVEVDYNDQVKVGQVLAQLDTSKLSAQILQSQAALDSSRAKVLQTKATIKETRAALERLQEVGKLSNFKAVSKSDLDAAEAALARAEADDAGARAAVSQAEATLKLNQTDLAKTDIRSPINGIVLARSVEPGQTVAASLQAPVLFTLAEDLSKMELDVDVDEADVGQVRAGQPAVFTVDAYPDRTYPASITQVRYGSKTTNGVVTYETILQVDNSDLSLRPGMTATADITVNRVKNTLVIPNAALRFVPAVKETGNETRKGSVLSKLFPHRPHDRSSKVREEMGSAIRTQNVWILAYDKPVAVKVTTGLTDGTSTQVIHGDIKQGTALIVDMETGQP
jgi:HlyD family secretion protein